LVDARFEGRLVLLAGFVTVAVALGAFAIAVTVAAAATTAATAATAAILANSVIGSADLFGFALGLLGCLFRQAEIFLVVLDGQGRLNLRLCGDGARGVGRV